VLKSEAIGEYHRLGWIDLTIVCRAAPIDQFNFRDSRRP